MTYRSRRHRQQRPKTSAGVLFLVWALIGWFFVMLFLGFLGYQDRKERELNKPNWIRQIEREMAQEAATDRYYRELEASRR